MLHRLAKITCRCLFNSVRLERNKLQRNYVVKVKQLSSWSCSVWSLWCSVLTSALGDGNRFIDQLFSASKGRCSLCLVTKPGRGWLPLWWLPLCHHATYSTPVIVLPYGCLTLSDNFSTLYLVILCSQFSKESLDVKTAVE